MNTQNEKRAIINQVTTGLSLIFESFVTSVDYEIQDNFKCVLFEARGVDSLFNLTSSQELKTLDLMRELDDMEISWLVALYDQRGKLVTAVNGEKQ